MVGQLTSKSAKDAAVSPNLFQYMFWDMNGNGTAGFAPVHAVINSQSAVIDPATAQQFPAALGRATMAGSLSVTLASDQASLPVNLTGSLPGFAAAPTVNIGNGGPLAQESGGNLDTIASNTTSLEASLGSISDTAYTGTGSASLVSVMKGVFTQFGAVILGAGTASIGKVQIDQSIGGVTNGVQVTALPALPSGANTIGSLITRAATITLNPNVQTVQYVAGQEVGGVLSIAEAVLPDGVNSSKLLSASIIVKSQQSTGSFTLYLFNQNPTNSGWADLSTPAIALADMPFLIGALKFTTPDLGLTGCTIFTLHDINMLVTAANGNNALFGILVANGTMVFSTSSDVILNLGLEYC